MSANKESVAKATREGFGEGIMHAANQNENVVVLSAGLADSLNITEFSEEFPKRFFEMGIAEQNMASVAAGLALEGKIPFMTSFAAFSPARNWDQIRLSICYSEANVKIISSHAGFSYGGDGAVVQALEDIAMMRVLPNMVVIAPCDALEAQKATLAAVEYKGPVYIRLTRVKSPTLTKKDTKFEIGKAYVFQDGTDITILSTGISLTQALEAAQELEKDKLSCEVIHVPTIKPLDEKTILTSLRKTKKAVTIEEHQQAGGFGSAIAELTAQKFPIPIKIVGTQDTFGESGEYEELIKKYGVDKNAIKKAVLELMHES